MTPFYPLRDAEISYKVLHGERPAKPINASDSGISDGLWQLLARCWDKDDTRRPEINEIFQHLHQEPEKWLNFPPSRLPQAPSYESIPMSATHKHGNGSRPELACSRTYPPPDDIFRTARTALTTDLPTPTEGMSGAPLWTIDLNTPLLECPPFPMPMSPIDAENSSHETPNPGRPRHL